MLVEEAAQLAFAEAEAAGKRGDRSLVQRPAVDEHQRARHRVRGAVPGAARRRGLGPAAPARAKAGGLRRGGGRIEADVLAPRRPRRADRPAIDAGRPDPGEEAAIKAGIPRRDRPVAGVEIETHGGETAPQRPESLAIFGHGHRAGASIGRNNPKPSRASPRRRLRFSRARAEIQRR